jgi:hypothetical protein
MLHTYYIGYGNFLEFLIFSGYLTLWQSDKTDQFESG